MRTAPRPTVAPYRDGTNLLPVTTDQPERLIPPRHRGAAPAFVRRFPRRAFALMLAAALVTVACSSEDSSPKANEVIPTTAPSQQATSNTSQGTPDAFRVALSVSPFAELLVVGGKRFRDGARTVDDVRGLAELLMAHGGNELFIRASTERTRSPRVEDRSLDRTLERGELARALGLRFNPEFGLFGTYGDLSCQTAPSFAEYPEIGLTGQWETIGTDQMVVVLRRYGEVVAGAIRDAGVVVSMWDIGNEVDFGTAGVAPRPLPNSYCDKTEGGPDWYRAPNGVDPVIGTESVQDLLAKSEPERIAWLQTHVWPHEGRLLAAFRDGVRALYPDARFSTHLGGVASNSATFAIAFWRAMRDAGYVPDEFGFSFYPSSPGASLASFQATVRAVRAEFDRPVFVAEYAYPAALNSGGDIWSTWNREEPGYPISEDGQARLLADLTAWGRKNGLSGIRPWAPEVSVGDWGPMALFRPEDSTSSVGVPRPSLDAIASGLRQ